MSRKKEQIHQQEIPERQDLVTESSLCSECGTFISIDRAESETGFESYMTIVIGEEELCDECDEKLQNIGDFVKGESLKYTRNAIENGLKTNHIQVCVKGRFVEDKSNE